MKNLTLAGLTCLVYLLVDGCGTSTPTYRLEYKYSPGSVISYQQVSQGTIIAKEHDSVATNRQATVTSNITYTVRRVVDDTTWEIQQKMESMYHSLNRLDSTVTDTTESAPDMMIYIAPNGRIVDLEYASTKPGMDNTAYMKEYFRQGTPVFPEGAVPVGYAWTQTYDVTVDGAPVQVSTDYSIKAMEKRQGYECVVVGYSGKMVIPFEASPSDTAKRHGVDRLTNEGVMYHAVKDGITIAQTERWVLTGDRKKLKDGIEISYTVEADYQVTYDLKAISKQ
jgi:hypothetical protein